MRLLDSKRAWLIALVVVVVLVYVSTIAFGHWYEAACPGSAPCD